MGNSRDDLLQQQRNYWQIGLVEDVVILLAES